MTKTRELTTEEQILWSKFAGVLELLPAALNSQLSHDADLTLFDYFVLSHLSTTPGQTMRMTALAVCTNATLPRLSRVASRLESDGLLERFPCPEDGRATNVRLTHAGAARLAEATPEHLRAVDALVLDVLSDEQAEQLEGILDNLLDALHPGARTAIEDSTRRRAV